MIEGAGAWPGINPVSRADKEKNLNFSWNQAVGQKIHWTRNIITASGCGWDNVDFIVLRREMNEGLVLEQSIVSLMFGVIFVKMLLSYFDQDPIIWSSYMNIRPQWISHSSHSWSRAGWRSWKCEPAGKLAVAGSRHPAHQTTQVWQNQFHSKHPANLGPQPPATNSWSTHSRVSTLGLARTGPGRVTAGREQGWNSFLVSPSWKIFCKTFFLSLTDVTKTSHSSSTCGKL